MKKEVLHIFLLINDSLYPRLNSHYEIWNYKKKKKTKMKSIQEGN